jgi:hypothetical protein
MQQFKFIILSFVYSIVATSGDVMAQATPINDMYSIPLKTQSYTNIEGSPYLNENWVKGSVKFKDSKPLINLDLKFDQVKGVLIFKNDLDQEFAFVTNVQEFDLPLIGMFRSGYPNIKGTNDKTFFQVLADGKTQLLKYTKKAILETKPFYSGTTQRSIVQDTKYYIFKSDGMLVKVKYDPSSIINHLEDREAELTDYVKKYKLNWNNEDSFIKLIEYYNSL